jgi:small GTP-binding protein
MLTAAGALPPLTVKVVLVGESSVGKTSLASIAHDESLSGDYTPTVGASFVVKSFAVDGAEVRLHVWDTAGQERYRALTPMYYRDAQCVVLVYAIDDGDSFERLKSWRRDIENECDPAPRLVVVGNKLDLVARRAVAAETAEAVAAEMGAQFYEISAREQPSGVIAIFAQIARDACQVREHKAVRQIAEVCPVAPAKKACGC